MKTFFCRHSSKFDMDQKTLDMLWEEDYMAIHYPNTKDGVSDVDSDSLIPLDYAGSAKGTMNTLKKIEKEGGFVFTMYENMNLYKIGFVEPNTDIERVPGVYGDKSEFQGRKAILKCIRFKKSLTISRIDGLSLICAQPRQGTLCTWHAVGKRVENIFKGIPLNTSIANLTPDLQEVLCSEYLRMKLDKTLPKLESLLTPVGRTMKDVDIVGLTNDGIRVLAQVTYGNLFHSYWKIDKLNHYSDNENCELILFCKNPDKEFVGNIRVYDIEKVFHKFIETGVGKSWISMVK